MTLCIRLTPDQTDDEFVEKGNISIEVKTLFDEPCIQIWYTYVEDSRLRHDLIRLETDEWVNLKKNIERIDEEIRKLMGGLK